MVVGSGSSVLTAYDSLPTNLSSFVNNQILPVNSTTDPWRRVTGSNTQHGFKINGAVDPNNANNYGASYTGDMYGSLSTEEGGQPLSASSSCIERFEVQMNSGGDDTLTVLIKKLVCLQLQQLFTTGFIKSLLALLGMSLQQEV